MSVTSASAGPSRTGGWSAPHAVHLAHPLLVHLPADGRVGVLVADQDAVLVVVVGARDVDQALACPGRARGETPEGVSA